MFTNASAFAAQAVPFHDERGADVVVVLAKATFSKRGSKLVRAEEQVPVRIGDVPTDPAAVFEGRESSIRYPSDVTGEKPGADVVVVGSAVSTRPVPSLDVALPTPQAAPPTSTPRSGRGFTDARATREISVRVAAGSALPFDPAASKLNVTGASPPLDRPVDGAPVAKGRNSEAAPAPVPTLSIEQHASLHVELELHPQSHAEILRRYFVSQEQLARIDAAYHARMATDENLRTEWNAAYTTYRRWFIASSGKHMP